VDIGKKIGLYLGPIAFVVIGLLPLLPLETSACKVLGVVSWMLIWWITEAVPMAVTSLLPLILFPLCGVMSLEKTCLSYSNRFVFLFLGGFLIALAMEKWNLHRRLALNIVHTTGNGADRIILGFLLASWLISMWISNTATTLMMLPIASSVVALLVSKEDLDRDKGVRNFALTMMLSIAYGSSIGGIATLVGSPPNASMAAILDKSFGYDVTFFEWMKIGLPFSFFLLILAYFVLVKMIYPNKLGKFELGQELISQELRILGQWKRSEKFVFVVFILTAVLWIAQEPLTKIFKPLGIEFSDTGIALIAGCSLFLIPSDGKKSARVLEWVDTQKLPWGVLLMFGGGMSLAEAFSSSGLVQQITGLMEGMDKSNMFLFLTMLCGVGLLMTALMSNIAMVNIFVPVVGALALGAGKSPELFAIPVTIAASCDFMFPMSTPPNAIAYSSGYVKAGQMFRAGVVLNVLSFLLLMVLVWVISK
jgi:solute carrier family 13 (sodium-dependent dicarboxylate transporter), member 2/3/5